MSNLMPKIIVEVCQNHNGDRALLKEMIHAAKKNGADIIKGQVIFSEDLTPRQRFDEGHEENNGVRKTIKRPFAAEREKQARPSKPCVILNKAGRWEFLSRAGSPTRAKLRAPRTVWP